MSIERERDFFFGGRTRNWGSDFKIEIEREEREDENPFRHMGCHTDMRPCHPPGPTIVGWPTV